MTKFRAMKAVYSYYFPETRVIVDEVHRNYQHELFLTKSPVVLDDYHEPVIAAGVRFFGKMVPHLRDFKWRYPTAGSSEGIREYLTKLQTDGTKKIYVLKGEYEGYAETAKTRNIRTQEVDLARTDPAKLRPGVWFISNPSARDGNLIPSKVITDIADAGHKIFYDLSYVGSTRKQKLDLDHKNIVAAAVSLSKPYGLFRYRIGFLFTRDEVPALYANKWFKNIPSLMIADRLFGKIKFDDLYKAYRVRQEEIVAQINADHGLNLRSSDALLLAYLPRDEAAGLTAAQKKLIAPFLRGDTYRFCLTPYFEDEDKIRYQKPERRRRLPRRGATKTRRPGSGRKPMGRGGRGGRRP